MLFVLVWMQRWLHRELHGILLLLTRRPGLSVGLFSVLFLPGVILHELSHWITAKVLRVKTGKISVLPKVLPKGKVQLGYVEVAGSDILRDSLIGAAPLVAGLIAVGLIAIYKFQLPVIAGEQVTPSNVTALLRSVFGVQDGWLWLYFLFAVSTTMMPSESDRHAWLPLLLVFGVLFAAALFFGAGNWLQSNLSQPLEWLAGSLTFLFVVCNLLHICLILPLFVLRIVISKLTGYEIR